MEETEPVTLVVVEFADAGTVVVVVVDVVREVHNAAGLVAAPRADQSLATSAEFAGTACTIMNKAKSSSRRIILTILSSLPGWNYNPSINPTHHFTLDYFPGA